MHWIYIVKKSRNARKRYSSCPSDLNHPMHPIGPTFTFLSIPLNPDTLSLPLTPLSLGYKVIGGGEIEAACKPAEEQRLCWARDQKRSQRRRGRRRRSSFAARWSGGSLQESEEEQATARSWLGEAALLHREATV